MSQSTTAQEVPEPGDQRPDGYYRDLANRMFADAAGFDCGFPECLKGDHDPMADPATWSHDIVVDRVGECIDSVISVELETGRVSGRLEFEGATNDITEGAEYRGEAEYFAAASRLMKSHGRVLESLKRGGVGQVLAARYVRTHVSAQELQETFHLESEEARMYWLGVYSYPVSWLMVLSAGRPNFIAEAFAAFEGGDMFAAS